MIRCRNGHLYTGISTDVERRLSEHRTGKGAKYLRGKDPLELVLQQRIGSHSDALKAEAA
ncbi:MAG: GIY-YIG nuclease family protein, partial [Mariprofundaceae bacterium]|nr:GIY-YIG nuclease family protein [Mariprofundaceae bacterium]